MHTADGPEAIRMADEHRPDHNAERAAGDRRGHSAEHRLARPPRQRDRQHDRERLQELQPAGERGSDRGQDEGHDGRVVGGSSDRPHRRGAVELQELPGDDEGDRPIESVNQRAKDRMDERNMNGRERDDLFRRGQQGSRPRQ